MKIPTHMDHTLTALRYSTLGYDENIKEVLADVQILARILKYSIKELREVTIEELIPCLQQTDIEIGARGIDPGITNLGKIQSTNTEDIVLNEGYISFDIRFSFVYKEQDIKIIINIEAQKSSDPKKLKYHIESRMVYYLARLISSQKNVEFFHSDYDNIKKVYSIWICMDTADEEDSIYEFSFKPKAVYGSTYDYAHVDKMCGIIIRIRENFDVQESKNKLIAMLEDILIREKSERKKKLLSEKYGIQMTVNLERRINVMCNLSENIVEYAMEHGYKEGMNRGLEEGREKGIEQGIQQGIQQGIRQGMEQGIEQGVEKGENLLASLINNLLADERNKDIALAVKDEIMRKELYKEYGLI